MSVFKNIETRVEKFSTGIKDLNNYNKISNGAASKEYLNKKAVLEHCEDIDDKAKKSEKDYNYRQKNQGIFNKQLLESQLLLKVNELTTQGKVTVFKEILFEVFKKALYLDESFIMENYENVRALTDSYVDNNKGIKLLESATQRTNSPLLRNMLTLCENTARKVATRKMQQINECRNPEQLDDINFEMNEEEKETFNYEKDKLGIDELAKLVKDKVLTVVQDEKSREAKQEELYSDIEGELKENPDVTTEEAAKEALAKIAIKQNPIEETTLFNALLRHSYKELLENVAIASDDGNKEQKRKEENEDLDDIDYDIEDEVGDDDVLGSDDLDIDMDLVLAEAITKYTLMEMAYTIRLEEYSIEAVRKVTQSLLK